MSGQRYPVGTRVYYWPHEEIRLDATVTSHGRVVSGVYTEIRLEDGTTRRVHRSQLKKARLGTRHGAGTVAPTVTEVAHERLEEFAQGKVHDLWRCSSHD